MSNKERWFAVSGTWAKNNGSSTDYQLRLKIYDDVSSAEEALGKFMGDCLEGQNNVKGYNLALWASVLFLVPKEPTIIDPNFEQGH